MQTVIIIPIEEDSKPFLKELQTGELFSIATWKNKLHDNSTHHDIEYMAISENRVMLYNTQNKQRNMLISKIYGNNSYCLNGILMVYGEDVDTPINMAQSDIDSLSIVLRKDVERRNSFKKHMLENYGDKCIFVSK